MIIRRTPSSFLRAAGWWYSQNVINLLHSHGKINGGDGNQNASSSFSDGKK